MPTQIQIQPGQQNLSDGVAANARGGRQGDVIVSELHGRYYEQNYRGNTYSGGMTATSINAATFTTATLGATATPIVGVWNQATSPVNLVIQQVNLQVFLTALTSTGPGAFMWCTSTGNNAISTGNTPLNRKTLLASGSYAKDMSGVALTGLTNNLVVRNGASIAGGSLYNISNIATAAGFQTTLAPSTDNIDGQWIVPPGGVLALLCTTTPVAHSAATGLIWEEVPL